MTESNYIIHKRKLLPAVVVDMVLITLACLLPTLTHIVVFPLYRLNPMLMLVLASMLVVGGWKNGVVMALLLPLVSSIAVGMPSGLKVVCMMAELLTICSLTGLFFSIAQKKENKERKYIERWGLMIAAIVIGKGVYYLLKALLIAPTTLIDTNIYLQILVLMLWSSIFAIFYKNKKNI